MYRYQPSSSSPTSHHSSPTSFAPHNPHNPPSLTTHYTASFPPTTPLAVPLQLPQLPLGSYSPSPPSLSTWTPLGTKPLPPTAVNDAVFPPPPGGGGGGGGGGSALFGGGPSGDAIGDAGVTRSGISSGASCGRDGLVGELGGVAVPAGEGENWCVDCTCICIWEISLRSEEWPVIDDADAPP